MSSYINTGVNRPTDVKKKEADIARKLQIYGIANAFQAGKVPSNDQIDIALNSFVGSRALTNPPKNLSTEGHALIADVREAARQAQLLLLSKNHGNLLQDFVYQTRSVDPNAIQKPGQPFDKKAAKTDGDSALQGLKTLGTLIITNGQFRKLLKDASVLFRDIASDAAGKAANKVRPSEQDLQTMDMPANDDTWHEAPSVNKDTLKERMSKYYKGNPKEDAKEVMEAGHTQHQQAAGVEGSTADGTRAGAQAAKNSALSKLSANIPEETKEQARRRKEEYRERSRNYFNQKMPQERRDQLIFRLKKMVLECQSRPDYQEAIETLLVLGERYGQHASRTAKEGTQSAAQARTQFQKAEDDLRTLIERFANGTSMGGLIDSVKVLYQDADRDPELKNWFSAMDRYIRRCLQEQGYIITDESTEDGRILHDKGRYLLREKYRVHTNQIVDEARFLGKQFDNDPQNKAFAQAMQKLFNDLGNDPKTGKPVFKRHLLKDISEVILPAAFENVAYIPIPRIEYSDPTVDAIIENLVLESDNFTPNILQVESDHHFRWGRRQIQGFNRKRNAINVQVSGIQMDLRDVSYHIKKKQGFPSITDTGIVDIILPGEGFCFGMKLSTADTTDRQHFFKVDKVDVDVKHLKINLKQSKYKFMFKLVQPFLLKILRPVIQKVAEKALKDKFNEMDALMFQVKQEVDRSAQTGADTDKQNVYARYGSALKSTMASRKEQAKKKAAEKTADKKLNFAITREDSIFPNISLPGGISSKATEYRELARKGDKWESPVFSVGKAAKSTHIPPPPEIRRHDAPRTMTNGGAPVATTGMNPMDKQYMASQAGTHFQDSGLAEELQHQFANSAFTQNQFQETAMSNGQRL